MPRFHSGIFTTDLRTAPGLYRGFAGSQREQAGKRSLSYAVHKLNLSFRSACPATIDLDPSHSGPKVYMVQTDPAVHVRYANAITLAYSAIEELELEVRVRKNAQSRMPDGTWNPAVRKDLETRLKANNIGIDETHVWLLRGRPTRIEQRKRPPKAVKKPPWSRGAARDVELTLIDAIALASWLRSKVSTHRFNANVRSLTAYDVRQCAVPCPKVGAGGVRCLADVTRQR